MRALSRSSAAAAILGAAILSGCKGRPAQEAGAGPAALPPGTGPLAGGRSGSAGSAGPAGSSGPAKAPDPAVVAALDIIGEAQRPGPGIAPSRLDLPLMDAVRQLEAARAAQQHKGTPKQIEDAFRGARPDPAVSPDERARRYAAGASRRLGSILRGRCGGSLEPLGQRLRVQSLTGPIPGAPQEVEEQRRRLGEALAPARLVAVQCEVGSVGMLLVPGGGAWRVMDIVPTGRGRGAPFEQGRELPR